jgi:RND family efflux transporter MFP subunit
MKKISMCIAFISLIGLSGCEKHTVEGQAQMPPEVDVAYPLQHEVIEWDEYTGRFEAVNRVDIRSRVTGFLVDKKFKDGQIVKKNDILFVIDPRPFEYQLQQAEASYTLAQNEYNRAVNLRKTRAIAQEDLERRQQEYRSAEAILNEAKLDVEFTQVTAPIDGRVSQTFIDVGNLIRANETLLTRVVSIDPIHFEFEASQTQLLNYIRLDRAGDRKGSAENPNPMFIKLQDEDEYVHSGRMDFVDNVVDAGTGTISGRALVSNTEQVIFPGLFGRARLIGRNGYQALLLPESAIQTDQNRSFVYVINADNQATRSYVELGEILDNKLIPIRSGLSISDRVVISGIQRIRAPQQPVTPNEVAIEWGDVDLMPSVDSVPSLQEMIENGSNEGLPTSTIDKTLNDTAGSGES